MNAATHHTVKNHVNQWVQRAQEFPTTRLEELSKISETTEGLNFLIDFVDGVIRTEDPKVSAELLQELAQELPAELPPTLSRALKTASRTSKIAPETTIRSVKYVLRNMLSDLLVSAEEPEFGKFLTSQQHNKLNIHLLGEAVLGQQEAHRRLQATKELITRDDVDYVSLKVSSVIGPHNPWGHDDAVARTARILKPLFELAASQKTPTFINLDMEEYRDLELTLEVFQEIMGDPALRNYSAGLVLQAYLPDAWQARLDVQAWAQNRVERGGAPIRVRLVKGANLPMEQVQAENKGWHQAPYPYKIQTDANYLRLLDYSLDPERLAAVHIGIAGHNLFHMALAHQWITERNLPASTYKFEALLGMGQSYLQAASETVGELRYYVPVVEPENFDAAIAYLVRRLEESAHPDNFLVALNRFHEHPEGLETEYQRYLDGVELLASQSTEATLRRRDQNRLTQEPAGTVLTDRFANEPDSDPSLAVNRTWAQHITDLMGHLKNMPQDLSAFTLNSEGELDALLERATQGAVRWQERTITERAELLNRAADSLAVQRGELAAIMGSETGKTLDQSDPEVSEAIDFARFYAREALKLTSRDGAEAVPRDVTVVAPPWNFPLAIPAGSTFAALAAGSAVVLKPAPQAPRTSLALARACWEAGIPTDALQMAVLDEHVLGEQLIADPRVDQVILTGSVETAELFRTFNPGLRIFAETSGKNSLIITDSADYDEAVKDLVASAFGHAGQKCSAASTAILVGSAATSTKLRDKIIDAVSSLTSGWPTDLSSQLGPLIQEPEGKLLQGLTELEPGQRWVLEPQLIRGSSTLYTPGIRAGVKPGSAFHLTEYFGPILGLMQAPDLKTAVKWANAVDYGLTAGLHSLKPAEIRYFQRNIQAGNVYINRGTTGAIVNRQPFGGWKQSAVGPTAKAGGPNYLWALTDWRPTQETPTARQENSEQPIDWDQLIEIAQKYDDAGWVRSCITADIAAHTAYFAPQDLACLKSEANVLRYFTHPVTIRYVPTGPEHRSQLMRTIAAGLICQTHPQRAGTEGELLQVSLATADPQVSAFLDELQIRHKVESAEEFQLSVNAKAPEEQRVRSVGEAEPLELPITCAHYAAVPVRDSVLEAQPFLSEQSVSMNTHRYGSERLGLRKLLD